MTTNTVTRKYFYIMHNVGRARYLLNSHDGVKTHGDGSRFVDAKIFSNKKKLAAAVKVLLRDGYIEKGGYWV